MDRVWAAVISGIFGVLYIWYQFYLKYEKEEDEGKNFRLIKHPIFSRIDYIMSQIDYSLEFESVAKYMLVSDVMEMYFKIVKENLYKMAEEVDDLEGDLGGNSVYELHLKYLNNIIQEYTDIDTYKSHDIDKKSKETLELFINKFQLWHSKRIDFLIERSADISNSGFYKDDRVKVAALFDVYIGIMASTLQDGSKTLQRLNGDLDGRIYRGLKIGGEENGRQK